MFDSYGFRVWRVASIGSFVWCGCAGSVDRASSGMGGAGNGASGAGPAVAGADHGVPPEPPALVVGALGPSAGRRLTKNEYVNTVADVLGPLAATQANKLLQDDFPSGTRFRNDLTAVAVSYSRLEDYDDVAAEVAAVVPEATLSGFAPCTDSSRACQTGFVNELGSVLYRRPLSSPELENLGRLFVSTATTDTPFDRGARAVLQVMLQSPYFLYKLERLGPTPDGYEIATRLSFTLWQSGPDRTLLDAAKAGSLATPVGVAAAAADMLDDPRARRGVRGFGDDWLRLYNNLTRVPDSALGLTQPVFEAMRAESLRFVERILLDERAPLARLLSDRKSEFGPELAGFYGVEVSPDGHYDFSAEPKRVGLLTQLAVLGSRVYGGRASIVHRGLAVAEDLLCVVVPPEPPTALGEVLPITLATQAAAGGSERQQLAAHSSHPTCAACHLKFEPFGFALENYDVAGRYRDVDDRNNVLTGNGEVMLDGRRQVFANVGEFAKILSESPTAKQCLVRKFSQYALGRELEGVDDSLVAAVLRAIGESEGTYPGMINALAETGVFNAAAPEALEQR